MTLLTCRLVNEATVPLCVCPLSQMAAGQDTDAVPEPQFPVRLEVSISEGQSLNSLDLLRRSYHPQTTFEVTQIQTYLQTAETSLTILDSDLAHVHRVLSTLSTRRAALQSDITLHKSLLAPIRRLPNELLSEIFLSRIGACTITTGGGGSSGGNTASNLSFTNLHNDTLWTILQVSSLWRTTAQATPRLWNTLYIDLSPLQGKLRAYKNLLARLSTCLTHFLPTALPLNFAITGTHFQDSSQLFPLITTLCTHASRWGKTYFCPYTTNILASWDLDAKFRQLPSTPSLSALGLTSFNPAPGFIQTPTRFTDVPNLRKLALYDYRPIPNNSESSTFLPSFCHQLTHLYLESCPYYTYPDILPNLPRLTHLEILNKHSQSTRSLNSSSIPELSIRLPELRTLRATGWLGNLCFFLPRLDLPKIEKVNVLALTEQCHPCTCAAVKMRIVNEWTGTLRRDVVLTVNHAASRELKRATDDGIIEFLFADDA